MQDHRHEARRDIRELVPGTIDKGYINPSSVVQQLVSTGFQQLDMGTIDQGWNTLNLPLLSIYFEQVFG